MINVPLENVLLSLESGSRPKGGVSADSGDIPSIGGEHLTDNGSFDFTNIKRIPISFLKKMKSGHIFPLDILVVKDGATTGKTSFVRPNFPFREAAVNEHVFCVRVNPEKASPTYVYHFLRSKEGQKAIQLDFRGATVGGISREFAVKTVLPLPSLPEQKRIADILDRAEALRAKRRVALSQLDELTQSIFIDMFGDPIFNPKEWSRVQLIKLCSSADDIKCGPFGTQLSKDEYTTEGVPLWGIKHVNALFNLPTQEFLETKTAKRLIQYSIKPGDIVMTRKGTIGNCAVYPESYPLGIMHSDLLRLRARNKII